MNLEDVIKKYIQLKTTGGTDKTIRFEFIVDKNSCGELQMGREIFTKIADKLFDNSYLVVKNLIENVENQ